MSMQKFLVRTLTTFSYEQAQKWLNTYNSLPDVSAYLSKGGENSKSYTVKVYEYVESAWEC